MNTQEKIKNIKEQRNKQFGFIPGFRNKRLKWFVWIGLIVVLFIVWLVGRVLEFLVVTAFELITSLIQMIAS
jgi:cytoskeletal protein RodZ|tara:strand:- start:3949 stop:4164 length:216 start_codon:yes stop_codon:yes gene_type:complete